MTLSEKLGWRISEQQPDFDYLNKLFDWFIGLNIPYETVSNFELGTFIKTPEEMAECAVSGLGGHCVEHAVLWAEIARENGFLSSVVNADFNNYVLGVSGELTYAYALLELPDSTRIFSDTYYTGALLPIPPRGGIQRGQFVIKRISDKNFSFLNFSDGDLLKEDIVREDSDLAVRQRLFEQRYGNFFPFGVVAPYYQAKQPERRSIYYVPKLDRYLVQEKGKSYALPLEKLSDCDWIPSAILAKIREVTPRNRAERANAVAFLRKGIFNPVYTPLGDASRPTTEVAS